MNVLAGHGRAPDDARGRPRQVDAIGAPVVSAHQPGRRRRRRRSRTCPCTATFDRRARPVDRSTPPTSRCTDAGGQPVAGLGRVRPGLAHRSRCTPDDDARAVHRATRARRHRRQELARRGADLAAHVDVHHRPGHPARRRRPARPPSGATGVATDVAVTARFDRRLEPATVTDARRSRVRPREPGGAPCPRTVTYDDATRTVRLDPDARLAESTPTRSSSRPASQRDRRHADGRAGVAGASRPAPNLQVTARTPRAAGERDLAGRRACAPCSRAPSTPRR